MDGRTYEYTKVAGDEGSDDGGEDDFYSGAAGAMKRNQRCSYRKQSNTLSFFNNILKSFLVVTILSLYLIPASVKRRYLPSPFDTSPQRTKALLNSLEEKLIDLEDSVRELKLGDITPITGKTGDTTALLRDEKIEAISDVHFQALESSNSFEELPKLMDQEKSDLGDDNASQTCSGDVVHDFFKYKNLEKPNIERVEPQKVEDCVLKFEQGFRETNPNLTHFDPLLYKGVAVEASYRKLLFCDESRGFYNLALVCISSKHCHSELPRNHTFQKMGKDIFAIGIARSSSPYCENMRMGKDGKYKRGVYGQALFFLTTSLEILAYTYISSKGDDIFDCRFFVASADVYMICAGNHGPKIVRIEYDGRFHTNDEQRLRVDYGRHWNLRNIMVLPCPDHLFMTFWPQQVANLSLLPVREQYFTRLNVTNNFNGNSKYDTSDWDEFHNSAGFLKIPKTKNKYLGLVHRHYEMGDLNSWILKGYFYGYNYLSRFFTIESEFPYRLQMAGTPFCISSKEDNGECLAIQMIMSMVYLNNGSILLSMGLQDCESAVVELPWTSVKSLLKN